MKLIQLNRGQFAKVDDEDFENLSLYKWWAPPERKTSKSYVIGYIKNPGEEPKRLLMHRLLMNPDKSQVVDHINGDTLDNRRSNLRVCTNQENSRSRAKRLQKNNTSGFTGVVASSVFGKWGARIKVNGKAIHLGTFETKEDAAKAYDKAAKKFHGEYATLNYKP